jgi:hypothetical protein
MVNVSIIQEGFTCILQLIPQLNRSYVDRIQENKAYDQVIGIGKKRLERRELDRYVTTHFEKITHFEKKNSNCVKS